MKRDIPVTTIDTGIPLPPERMSILGTYPITQLDVGESILFPRTERNKVQVAASQLKRRTGKSFTIRAMDKDNCRIWRVA